MQVSDRTRLLKSYPTDAGIDLITSEDVLIPAGETRPVPIGTNAVIPEGHVGFAVCRSSWRKRGLICLSVIDPFYEGEYRPFVSNVSKVSVQIKKGERVLQLVIVPLSFVIFEPFEKRGGRGCGSTGH